MGDVRETTPNEPSPPGASDEVVGAFERLRTARHRTLLLDYDGTLVPIVPLPELASPDRALLELLADLSQAPNTDVHVVSGRARDSIEPWLGALPIWIHAEHGFWSRTPDGVWSQALEPHAELVAQARDVLRGYVDRTPGAMLETKVASVAFHYRRADPQLAEARLRTMRAQLPRALGPGVELLEGHKVLEVRLRGVNKGIVVGRVLAGAPEDSVLLAVGDDRTDEDLFAALPPQAITVRVGAGCTRAQLRVDDVPTLRRLLQALVDPATPSSDPPPSAR